MFFAKRRKGLIYEDPTKPGLRRRIFNTLLLLLLFRLLANIHVVNVNEERIHELLAQNPLLGAIDLFAGGDVLTGFSVVAVGLFPYLLAAGLVRLAARLIPSLRVLEKDSEEERFQLYTRIVTVPLAVVLAWGIMRYLSLETGRFPAHLAWFTRSSFLSSLLIVSAVTFGSWLTGKIKDWIAKHGIGPGESVILLVGSSLSFITWVADLVFSGAGTADVLRQLALNAVVGLIVVELSIPLLAAVRNIPMTNASAIRRQSRPGDRRDPSPILPLKLNHGGITPVSSAVGFLLLFQIAAMALAWAFPGKFAAWQQVLLAPTKPEHSLYWALLAGLVIAFTYLSNYTVLWKPYKNSEKSLAEILRTESNSFYITGVRPGVQSALYLSRVMARITLPAAVTLAFLAAGLPYVILRFTGQNAAVAIVAEVVFVKSFLDVRERYRTYREADRSYESLLNKKPDEQPWRQ
jgi:preprotein translocase subunit SecY